MGETEYKGPLAGIKVLELGSTISGPFCGRLLADFGADVIKVEPPEGDPVRFLGKMKGEHSLYAASIFRNKSLISVNLRTDAGRQILRGLAEKCDVVIENFRPGTIEKWGLGFDTLSAVNPGLVMVRITGYGQDGPYSNWPGYGVTSEAVSGLRHVTGDPDRPPPRVAVALTDYITALYGAFGAVMALLRRATTGVGDCVDAALYEGAFSFMEPNVPAFQQTGYVAGRAGSHLPNSTPNFLYPTNDGRFIHITAASDSVFARLAKVIGRPDMMEDSRYNSPLARNRNENEVDAAIARWTSVCDLDSVEAALRDASVPAARIFTMTDIFADPHFRSRNMLVDVPDDKLGTVTLAGVVPKLARTPGGIRHAGREVGADTARILAERLGMAGDKIEEAARSGAILCAKKGIPE